MIRVISNFFLKINIQIINKEKIWQWFFTKHLRDTLMVINVLFNNKIGLSLIGVFNRRSINILGKQFSYNLHSIFYTYSPESQKQYNDYYVYSWLVRFIKWKPIIVGFHKINGKWILMLASSCTERDFIPKKNAVKLKELYLNGLRTKQKLVKAKLITCAGIMPMMLMKREIIQDTPETEFSAIAVKLGITQVLKTRKLPIYTTPIIFIGGKGHLGSRITKKMRDFNVFNVDKNLKGENVNKDDWPEIHSKVAIIINLAPGLTVLTNYAQAGLIRKEDIVINESFPLPDIDKLPCTVGHFTGVKAEFTSSPLPGNYQEKNKSILPFCAVETENETKTEVVITFLK